MPKSDIEITDFNAFEEVIKSIENSCDKIKEALNSEKNNKEKINNTGIWAGAAQQVMYKKISMLCNNFPDIEYSCDVYLYFLKKTLDDYKAMIAAINANTDSVAESLDVNS